MTYAIFDWLLTDNGDDISLVAIRVWSNKNASLTCNAWKLTHTNNSIKYAKHIRKFQCKSLMFLDADRPG